MPILRKKSGRKVMSKKKTAESRGDSLAGDVTIDDYANSSRTCTRFKKAVINFTSEVKQETTLEKQDIESCCEVEDNVQVDSKDIEKIEGNDNRASKGGRRNRKAKSPEMDTEEVDSSPGTIYPLDIWFLISEYIRPEDVGNFALICKSTYYVTRTAKFWFHLYKSYYKSVRMLPERLQPQCMGHTYGLRACVIRALHHTYFPFRNTLSKSYYLVQEQPHTLVKRQCRAMWHRDDTMKCFFYFKLKEVSRSTNGTIKRTPVTNGKKAEYLEMLDEVAVNPEDGYKVLRVTCRKYSMLPLVIGLILQKVSLTLMPGFLHHRLQLAFGTSDVPSTLTTQVILNDVTHYQVLDWWHPFYPRLLQC